jgi:methyl-accepting chemotaxis protein
VPGKNIQKTASENISDLSAIHHLASSKISSSFSQGDESVDNLGSAITNISNIIRSMQHEVDESKQVTQIKTITDQYAEKVSGQVNEAVTALQFYDRLSQQMEKVRGAVNELGQLLAESSQSVDSETWLRQLRAVHQRLTEESGGAVITASESPQKPSAKDGNDASNCELF